MRAILFVVVLAAAVVVPGRADADWNNRVWSFGYDYSTNCNNGNTCNRGASMPTGLSTLLDAKPYPSSIMTKNTCRNLDNLKTSTTTAVSGEWEIEVVFDQKNPGVGVNEPCGVRILSHNGT